jgi:hypothetical protein
MPISVTTGRRKPSQRERPGMRRSLSHLGQFIHSSLIEAFSGATCSVQLGRRRLTLVTVGLTA